MRLIAFEKKEFNQKARVWGFFSKKDWRIPLLLGRGRWKRQNRVLGDILLVTEF